LSTARVVILGAIAGFTIYLGLPVGRLRTRSMSWKTFLNGVSAGILVFLLVDILGNAGQVLEEALNAAQHHGGSWTRFAALGVTYPVGLAVGLVGLLYVGRLWRPSGASIGPGAMSIAETAVGARREALRIGMTIATGIGLHNFSEGLAIGQSARSGEISLAVLLIVGFGLHNATEGFGIVGPLAAADVRPSWSWLLLAGLIGGGPTFLGTIVGNAFDSTYVFVACLALAAGAILYVVGELFAAGRRLSWEITLWGLFAGFLIGLATELVVVAAGA
jgi:ZIP family zinc transporter